MNSEINRLQKFLNDGYKIYIYGTGLWGRNVYHELVKNNICISSFVVSKKEHLQNLFGLPVLQFSNLNKESAVFVLGMNQHNTKEVYDFLVHHNFDTNRIIYANEIMGINDVRCGYDEVPCLDITTKIGCSVNCKYCPQDILLKEYFRENSNRQKYLSTETFLMCMNNMPLNTNYQFCGMAEPFLNPNCFELLRIACDAKVTVNLYTTLVGLNEEMLYKVMELPIEYVTLHVADAKQYAKIPKTDEYYHLLEIAVNYKRKNGKPFIDMCNAQTQPDSRVSEICKEKYIISSTLLDRAGNLNGESLVSKHIEKGQIRCGVCGTALNKNELLPDGTLLLCCMDYGMRHVLGSLKEQSYEEIMNGKEMQRIRKGMERDFEQNILCRTCSCANLED